MMCPLVIEAYTDGHDVRQSPLEQNYTTMIHNIGDGRLHDQVVASVCLSLRRSLDLALSI